MINERVRIALADTQLTPAERIAAAARAEIALALKIPAASIVDNGFDAVHPVAKISVHGDDQAFAGIVWRCTCWYTRADSAGREHVTFDFVSGHWSKIFEDRLSDSLI
jgi:hypothetical protein